MNLHVAQLQKCLWSIIITCLLRLTGLVLREVLIASGPHNTPCPTGYLLDQALNMNTHTGQAWMRSNHYEEWRSEWSPVFAFLSDYGKSMKSLL